MTTYWIPSILMYQQEIQVREVTLQQKSWSPLPMSDFKGFGTRIGRETRETKENNEKLSLRMADCIFEKLQHQMQKKNDIIKSNENLAKVRWVTSFKSHILGQLTLQFNGSTKNKYGGTRLLHLIGLTKSTRFAVLVQVKLIHLFLQGSTFGAFYFETYPNRLTKLKFS